MIYVYTCLNEVPKERKLYIARWYIFEIILEPLEICTYVRHINFRKEAHDRWLLQPFSKQLIEEKFEIKREYGDPPILAKRKDSTGPKSRDEIRKIVVSYYKNLHAKKLAPITIADSENDDDDVKMVEDESRDCPINPTNEIPESEAIDENEATSIHAREPSSYDVIGRVITPEISLGIFGNNECSFSPVR